MALVVVRCLSPLLLGINITTSALPFHYQISAEGNCAFIRHKRPGGGSLLPADRTSVSESTR